MRHISDKEFVGEMNRRLEAYSKALVDLKMLTTKLENVNRRLQESEATKSNFLSNIRNEINNPLTSILGLSRHLFFNDITLDDAKSISQNIYYEAFELNFQLNNIFLAAEIEAGESPIGVSNVEVENFLSRTITSFSHKIDDKKINVDFVCEGGDELVFKTDPLKLETILVNLLANAIEFSLEGKHVSVEAARKDDRLVVSIIDEGIGIAEDERELIFDRFRQLETGTQKSHRGHGLGLSVVKSLLNQLEGEIEFSGVAGEGSTFTVSIPEFKGEADGDVFSDEGNEFIFDTEEEF